VGQDEEIAHQAQSLSGPGAHLLGCSPADRRDGMRITVRVGLVALVGMLGGCVDDKDTQSTSPATATGNSDGTTGNATGDDPTGGDPTGGLPSMAVCEQYLNCLAEVAPDGLPDAQQGFGPDGTCWKGSLMTAEQCLAACQAGLDQWHEAFPDEPQCGTVGDGGTGTANGQYLFAVATTVDLSKPFQFIATFATDAASVLTLTLQPLTLDQGNVTTPRQPFGEPLEFTDIAVVDGKFAVDLGSTNLAGPTNPITGADIVASLDLAATIVDMDVICGTVTGDVTSPLMVSIEGSTFAAVRLADPKVLPTNVLIDCNGTKVTGP
jgi:hypothetical protein